MSRSSAKRLIMDLKFLVIYIVRIFREATAGSMPRALSPNSSLDSACPILLSSTLISNFLQRMVRSRHPWRSKTLATLTAPKLSRLTLNSLPQPMNLPRSSVDLKRSLRRKAKLLVSTLRLERQSSVSGTSRSKIGLFLLDPSAFT